MNSNTSTYQNILQDSNNYNNQNNNYQMNQAQHGHVIEHMGSQYFVQDNTNIAQPIILNVPQANLYDYARLTGTTGAIGQTGLFGSTGLQGSTGIGSFIGFKLWYSELFTDATDIVNGFVNTIKNFAETYFPLTFFTTYCVVRASLPCTTKFLRKNFRIDRSMMNNFILPIVYGVSLTVSFIDTCYDVYDWLNNTKKINMSKISIKFAIPAAILHHLED